MAVIQTSTNRDRAIELVKAALAGGALSQIPTAKHSDLDRIKAHSIYIMKMLSSLEVRLDEVEGRAKV